MSVPFKEDFYDMYDLAGETQETTGGSVAIIKSILKQRLRGGNFDNSEVLVEAPPKVNPEVNVPVKPPAKAFFESAKYSYEKAPNVITGNMRLIVDTPTLDAYLNQTTNSILIGLRGTEITSAKDLKADASLIANNLRNTKRYKTDKATMDKIVQRFPPDQFNYYLSGHSLAGAVVNQFRRDYPFVEYGKTFNSAFQPADLVKQDPNVKRLYTPTDFLYNLGGKYFRNVKLVPEKQPQGFFEKIKAKLTPSGIRGHFIDNFENNYGGGLYGGNDPTAQERRPPRRGRSEAIGDSDEDEAAPQRPPTQQPQGGGKSKRIKYIEYIKTI